MPVPLPRGMGDTILCACGCQGSLKSYDDRKRPRTYLKGHNIRRESSRE